jgi:hypothetical protein
MADPRSNLSATYTQLTKALQIALDKDGGLKPVYVLIDQLVNNFRIVSMNDTITILRTIINPYGTRSIDHKSLLFAIKMVKFMQWWLRVKPIEAPSKGLIELVRERRTILLVRQQNGPDLPRLVYSAFKRLFLLTKTDIRNAP